MIRKQLLNVKKIDLSNNPNLTWFDFEQEVQFETLTDLNLSGCNLTGQNLGFRAGSKIHRSETVEGLPPGLAFAGKVSAINAPSIRYLNLEGNGLNRTGIRSWLFSCVQSLHYPTISGNYPGDISSEFGGDVSGYLNIKNQSSSTAVYNSSKTHFIDRSILSGIEVLSGKGWIVEYDHV